MNRKNFLTLALTGLFVAILPKRSESAPVASATGKMTEHVVSAGVDFGTSGVMHTVVKSRAELAEFYPAPASVNPPVLAQTAGIVTSPDPISGVDLPFVSVWCQCPACLGSGFRGEDRDQCGYCRMNGRLVSTESFAMYNGEGNAEVWRALVWHEWSQRNWREGKDYPQPWLPGMLCYIGQQHPEVYDTAVRECIFAWLEKRFDKAHAQAQYDAWVSEVERQNREDVRFKHLYARDDAASLATR